MIYRFIKAIIIVLYKFIYLGIFIDNGEFNKNFNQLHDVKYVKICFMGVLNMK